ncbi:hypothetical protein SUGI_0559810 [Cryptomeria japonica]|nr:hypothetical protein SUGI_0559810 [Cryptomeria japonica]
MQKELDALKVFLLKIQLLNMEMQEYRRALNSGRTGKSPHHPLPSTVNNWLNELNALLEEASDLARHCTIRSYSGKFPSTSSTAANMKYIEEVLVVGQDSVSIRLVDLIDSKQHKNASRFGILGKGGAEFIFSCY